MLTKKLTYQVRKFVDDIAQSGDSMGTRDLARFILRDIDKELAPDFREVDRTISDEIFDRGKRHGISGKSASESSDDYITGFAQGRMIFIKEHKPQQFILQALRGGAKNLLGIIATVKSTHPEMKEAYIRQLVWNLVDRRILKFTEDRKFVIKQGS